MTIKQAVGGAASVTCQTDTKCATGTEAAAKWCARLPRRPAVMSRVLDPAAFLPWFDQFLASPESAAFKPLRSISFDAVGGRGAGPRARRSHLAGAGGRRGRRAEERTAEQSAASAAPATRRLARPIRRPRGTDRAARRPIRRPPGLGSPLPARRPAHHQRRPFRPETRASPSSAMSDLHAEQGQEEVVTAAFDAPLGQGAGRVISAVDGRRTMISRWPQPRRSRPCSSSRRAPRERPQRPSSRSSRRPRRPS